MSPIVVADSGGWRSLGKPGTQHSAGNELGGTYVNVEPFHLFRYLDEQSFRYNNRGNRKESITNSDRFKMVLVRFTGKHITYDDLTGKGHLPVVEQEPF